MNEEELKHYTTLANSRCEYGNTFRSLQQLFRELCFTRNSLTSFNNPDKLLGVYIHSLHEGSKVFVYDYNHSMVPIAHLTNVQGELRIYIHTSVLKDLDEAVSSIKRVLNALILKG